MRVCVCPYVTLPSRSLVGEQPYFEVVAPAPHVRATRPATGDHSVAGDHKRDLGWDRKGEREKERVGREREREKEGRKVRECNIEDRGEREQE